MTTVQRDPTVEEKGKLDYSKGVIPYVPEETKEFKAEVDRFLKGEWEDDLAFTAFPSHPGHLWPAPARWPDGAHQDPLRRPHRR